MTRRELYDPTGEDRRPPLKCSPYTVVCNPPTFEAQRGVKICASLVGGEEGEAGGGPWHHQFKTRKYQHALILSCCDVKCSRGVSAVGGTAVGM